MMRSMVLSQYEFIVKKYRHKTKPLLKCKFAKLIFLDILRFLQYGNF